MNKYECAIVLTPGLGSDGLESSTNKYKEVITSNGGSLTAVDDWGKRSLAYEINYHREGFYYFFRFEGGKAVVDELDRQLKIDENVIRHMVVRDDPKPPPHVRPQTPHEPAAKKEGE